MSATLSMDLDMSRYRELAKETERVLLDSTVRAVSEAAIAGADHARHTHPHKTRTGRLTGIELRARLYSVNDHGAVAEIRNDTPYARYVEYPTKPHQIWPKEGHGFTGPLKPSQGRRDITDIGTHRVALRFQIGGRTVFAKMVNHPGTPGFPFMEPAQRYAADQIVFETERVSFVLVAALWN